MEHRTSNPEPSWPQSAYTRAYAAAEPGRSSILTQRGNDPNTVPATSQNHEHWSSVSTSFVDQQLGDSNNLSRSAFSLADYGHYNAYASVAAPGNYTNATPWATSPPNNHAFRPFTNFNPLQLTGNTFAAGFAADAAENVGTTLPTAPIPYAWGATAPTIYSKNNTFAPSVNSDSSSLMGSTFAANAAYNGGITYPTASNAYTGVAEAPAEPINNNFFAPFVNSNFSPLTESTFPAGFAADAVDNDGITYPTVPNAYVLGAAAPPGTMNHYMGPGFHYPDHALPMTDPLAADTNGNCYHSQFPTATSFNTEPGAATKPPNTSHATHPSDTAPSVLSQHAQQPSPTPRPTCATCNRSFGRPADLERHAKKHKTDGKVHRCGCGYSSYRKDKLDEHVRRSGHRAATVVVSGDGV